MPCSRAVSAAASARYPREGEVPIGTFLTQRLGIPLGSSPILSGVLSGTTLTLTVGGPGPLPLTLPAGVPAPAFGQTTIAVDESAGTLILDAGASAGVTAALHVTIAHA